MLCSSAVQAKGMKTWLQEPKEKEQIHFTVQKALKSCVSLVRSIITEAVTSIDTSSDPKLPNSGVLLLAVSISSSQEKSY